MKKFIKYFFTVFILSISIHTTDAKEVDTIIHVDQEHHSISAPEAFIHQWYFNGEKIEGATKKDLEIKETGTYKVEITNTRGEKTEIQNSFLVTAAGAIIKVYIIGDSTVCNYKASEYPQAGWGQVLPAFFNTANLSFSNNAIGGRSSRSFFEEGRWTPIKNALNPGDYVFIQWGHNDRDFSNANRYTPVADYKTYLTMYCNDVKAKGAIPVLISPMVLNAWTGTTMRNVFTENGNNYRGAMLEVATALNVAFVDLNMKSWNLYKTYGSVYNQHFIYKGFDPGEYPNYPSGINDGTHFQEMGAISNARMIVQGIGELSARTDMANLISNIKPQYQIAIAVNPVGSDQLTTKTSTYPQGLTITLKTIPKTTSTFQKWNNAGNTQISTAKLTTVTSGNTPTSYTAMYAGATTTCTAAITSSARAFCTGGSVILTASSGSSYKWFNGTTQVGTAATYSAIAAGSYTVEVTNASGCKATSAAVAITQNPIPVITQYAKNDVGAWTATSNTTLCEGSTIELGPQPNLATGWSWTGPNNFTSTLRNPVITNVTTTKAGTYTATYTDANGCKASSTFSLQVSAQAIPTITSPSTSFCPGSSVVLTASTSSSYKWFNGTMQVGTASTYTATAAGSYTVEVTNATGCKATSTPTVIKIGAAQQPPTISSPSTTFCAGASVVLTASAGSSYKWFNGTTQVGTEATYTATTAGSYSVEVTNSSGCKATSAPTVVTVGSAQQTPTISSPSTTFCAGASVVLTASAGSSYKWFNGTTQVGTASTYTATAAGSYTLEVTNTAGCKATSAPVTITESVQSTPAISAYGNVICPNATILLTASAGTSYKWFNGTTQVATTPTYTVTDAGSYTVEVTNSTGCKKTSAPSVITASSISATISASAKEFCAGESVLLTASAGASYKWFNGTTQVGTNNTYTVTAAGTYTLELTNTAGCKDRTSIDITTSNPTAIITSVSNSFCSGSSLILTANTGSSYKWFNGVSLVGTASTYTATVEGSYTLEVTNSVGCKAVSAPKTITVSQPKVWYADTDGDGLGDPKTSVTTCNQPEGYVDITGDDCPANADNDCIDCAGIANGTAVLDNCSICTGGTTGKSACTPTATINGTHASITVIPQPFDLNTTISVENYGNIQSLTIISASGALVESRHNINAKEISIGNELAAGLYSVIIQTEKGIYTTRIVKK